MVFSVAEVEWQHRDRIAQSDQLVDQSMGSIGPEPGVTYSVRWYLDNAIVHEETEIAGNTASFSPTADGVLRVEIEAVRDGLTSWQMQVFQCTYRVSPYSDYTDEAGVSYADSAGDTYVG